MMAFDLEWCWYLLGWGGFRREFVVLSRALMYTHGVACSNCNHLLEMMDREVGGRSYARMCLQLMIGQRLQRKGLEPYVHKVLALFSTRIFINTWVSVVLMF